MRGRMTGPFRHFAQRAKCHLPHLALPNGGGKGVPKAFPLRGRWHGEAVTDEVAYEKPGAVRHPGLPSWSEAGNHGAANSWALAHFMA